MKAVYTIQTYFTYILFIVVGGVHVSTEVNTRAEEAPAYNCYLLQTPTWGLLTGSPSSLKTGILTSATAAEGIGPIRACLKAK
jgi:hypothetical protein